MTPQESRAFTLREVIDFCEARMETHENPKWKEDEKEYPLQNIDRYFEAKEIKEFCEAQLKRINYYV